MNIEEAQELYEQILEICYQSENKRLIEVAESIYTDVMNTNQLSKVIISFEELTVVINEEEFTEEEEEYVSDIEEIIESLLEE